MPRLSPRTIDVSSIANPSAGHRLLRRAASAAVAGLVFAGAFAVAGCEEADADAGTMADLNRAYALRSAGDPDRAYVGIAESAAQSGGGDAASALSQELLGDVSVELAASIMAGPIMDGEEPLPGLIGTGTRALVLAEEANRLAGSLALGRTYVQTQQQRNPASALSGVDQRIASIREGENWSPGAGDATFETIQAVEARMTQLNQRLEQLRGQMQQLDQQRSGLLAQASELDQQSAQQPGQQGVETYRRVADLRTEAAGVAAGIAELNNQIARTTADLEEAQSLHASLEGAITALEAQQAAMRQNWEAIQAQIGQLQQTNQVTYQGGGDTLSSIESIGQELGATLERYGTLQADVVEQLDRAIESYGSAANSARGASASVRPLFSQAYREAFDAARMELAQAVARRQLAGVHMSAAAVNASLVRLANTLERAQQEMPSSLQMDPAAAYTDAVEQAAQALTEADEALTGLIGGQGAVASAAITQRAIVMSRQWELRQLIENVGLQIQSPVPTHQELRQAARDVISAAESNNAPLPPVVPFIAAPAPADEQATQPTTEPTTEPTTQPADEEAGDQPEADPAAEPEGEPEAPAGAGAPPGPAPPA